MGYWTGILPTLLVLGASFLFFYLFLYWYTAIVAVCILCLMGYMAVRRDDEAFRRRWNIKRKKSYV